MRTDSGFGGHSADDHELSQAACGAFGPPGDQSGSDPGLSVSLRQVLPLATYFQGDDVDVRSLAVDVHELASGSVGVFRAGEHDPVVFAATRWLAAPAPF